MTRTASYGKNDTHAHALAHNRKGTTMNTLNEILNHANRNGWPVLYTRTHEDWLVFGVYGPDEFAAYAAPEAARQIIGGAVIEEFSTPGAPLQYVLVDPDDAEAIARAEALLAEPLDLYESDEYYEAECKAYQRYLDAIEPDERLDTQRVTGIDLYAYGYDAITGRPLDGQLAIA